MNKRNRYLAIAGMACAASGLLTSVGGTWAMLQGRGWMTGGVGAGLRRGDDVPGGQRDRRLSAGTSAKRAGDGR